MQSEQYREGKTTRIRAVIIKESKQQDLPSLPFTPTG